MCEATEPRDLSLPSNIRLFKTALERDINIIDKTAKLEFAIDYEKYELCEPLSPSDTKPHWYCLHYPCIAVHKKGRVQFSGATTYVSKSAEVLQDEPLLVVPGKRTRKRWSPADLVLPRKRAKGTGILLNSGEEIEDFCPPEEDLEFRLAEKISINSDEYTKSALEAINQIAVQEVNLFEEREILDQQRKKERDIERDRYWNWVAERVQANNQNDIYYIENTYILLRENPNFSDFFYNAELHRAQPITLGRFHFARQQFSR